MQIPPGKESLPSLLKSLKNPNASVRCFAVGSLGDMGVNDADAVEALRELLHDKDAVVQKTAVKALATIGPRGLSCLIEAVSVSDQQVRREAVWALGKMGTDATAAVPALALALQDADVKVRKGAANALGAIGPQAASAIPALISSMKNTNLVLCRLVALALSQIGAVAVPALQDALASDDLYLRREAAWALGKIEGVTPCPVEGLKKARSSKVRRMSASVATSAAKAAKDRTTTAPALVEPHGVLDGDTPLPVKSMGCSTPLQEDSVESSQSPAQDTNRLADTKAFPNLPMKG